MRKYFVVAILLLLGVSACHNDDFLQEESNDSQRLEKLEMDRFILQRIQDTDEPFNWNEVEDDLLIKALELTDGILVVGYRGGDAARDRILGEVVKSEAKPEEEILYYYDETLEFLKVRVSKEGTVTRLRQMAEVDFIELNGYPIEMGTIREFLGKPVNPASYRQEPGLRTDMILDPYLEDPDYPEQVNAYDPAFGTIISRHNVDDVYREYGIYGEDIGLAVIDNGIVDWAQDLFEANGYGSREVTGYYNPLWFLPWTKPDGVSPQPSDALGISQQLEAQWLHGSGMIQSALVLAPNADIVSVRASTAIVILFPDQIIGIVNGIKAMAERPDIRVTNMSMGTFFYINIIRRAIDYYHDQGKIMGSAAGTSFEEIKDLLGVIFPANLPNTVAVTGIENRESSGGEFIAGSTAHTGEEVDFCVERSAASSEATARMVGMMAVVWSANPSMSREQLMDVLVRASYFYQETGQRDADFGWGTVDVLKAVELALAL